MPKDALNELKWFYYGVFIDIVIVEKSIFVVLNS